MDIDLLSKMVKELILDNERVVLPGLGSFVAEIVPATFSDKGYTINPPYRKLYFRSKPDEGSDLIPFYAKSNSVSEEIAEKVIVDFVTELKAVLFQKKTVIFPGLGRLRATKENNVFLMEAMWTRFLPCVQEAVRMVKDGVIGEVQNVFGEFSWHAQEYDPEDRVFKPELAGGSPFAEVMGVMRERDYSGTIVLENNYGSLPLCAQAEDRFELVEKDRKMVCECMNKI